jgi:hypothetical protein
MERRVEQTLARELPVVLGPGQDYRVDVRGLRLSGSMRRVTATGQRVVPAVPQSGAPVLDRLEVELRDVAYSRERRKVERVGRALVRTRVTASDISAFLQARRGLEVASLELREPDRFLLQARPSEGSTAAASAAALNDSATPDSFLWVEGRLVGAGSRVNFQVSAVRPALPDQTGGSPPPDWSASALSQRLSPLMDLSDLPLIRLAALRLHTMTVEVQSLQRQEQQQRQQDAPGSSRGVVVFIAEGATAQENTVP